MRRAALLLLVVGLAAAGCGSGGKSPSIASLGDTTTTSSSQSATPPAAGFSTGRGGGGGGSFQMKLRGGGLKYSKCMRAHGVHNFPDPDSSGGLTIDSSSGIDPSSPTFRSAQAACAKDLPNGGHPTPQQIAQMKAAALAFSACMRAHGIKDFPDPNFSSGGIRITMKGDLNLNNPTFQRAQSACQHLLPAGKGGNKG